MDFHCIFSLIVASDLRNEITITFWLIRPFRCSDTSGALVGKMKYSEINLPDFVHCCIPRGWCILKNQNLSPVLWPLSEVLQPSNWRLQLVGDVRKWNSVLLHEFQLKHFTHAVISYTSVCARAPFLFRIFWNKEMLCWHYLYCCFRMCH